MKFKRNWPLILLLIPLLFLGINCGGGESPVGIDGVYSADFQSWINTWPEKATDFVEWWNVLESKKGWHFEWGLKNCDPEEMYISKAVDCGRMTNLLMVKYEGEYQSLKIPDGGGDFTHAVFKGRDEQGVYWISFEGTYGKVCRDYNEIWTKRYIDLEDLKLKTY